MRTLNIWVSAENLGYFLNLLFWQRGISAYRIHGGRRESEVLGSVTAERGLESTWEQLSFWICLWEREKKCGGAVQVVAGCAGELISPSVWKVPGLSLSWCELGKRGTSERQLWANCGHTLSIHGPLLISATVAAGLIQAIFCLPVEGLLKKHSEIPKFSWSVNRKWLYTLKKQNWKKIPSSSHILPRCIMEYMDTEEGYQIQFDS